LPISTGILPPSVFGPTINLVNAIKFPIDVGKVPVTPMLFIFTDTIFELPSHVTPVHGVEQTGLKGDPVLLHLHPVTSVFVPRFVDAVKSHIAISDKDTVGTDVGIVEGILVGI
jgi:hypothetical protein